MHLKQMKKIEGLSREIESLGKEMGNTNKNQKEILELKNTVM